MAKKERRSRIVCLSLTCLLLGLNASTIKAEALPNVLSGDSTVADCVMSYYAMSGSAVADYNYINTLYNDLGSNFGTIYDLAENGMLTVNPDGTWQATSQLTQAIENTNAYSNLNLDSMFNVSAAEVEAGGGLAASSGAATLSGAMGCIASNGVLPVLGGITAAYWGGIALGTIASHMIEKYAPYVYTGMPISEELALPAGYGAVYFAGEKFYTFNNVYGAYCPEGAGTHLYFVNPDNFSSYYRWMNRDFNVNPKGLSNFGSVDRQTPVGRVVRFDSFSDITAAAQRGQKSVVKSPDLIGKNGNLSGQYDNGQWTVPDLKPEIDPGTQAGKPLTLQDWLDFANAVENNNNNTNPTPNNTTVYNNIVQRIVVPNPQNPTPDPDPDPDPDPNPNPDPYTPPVVTPVPDPSLPDPVPDQNMSEEPQQSENPQETEKPLDPIPTGKPWMLPDLTKKFPFCIPWDIASCFTLLKSNVRQAPFISWHFVSPVGHVDYTFNLDLSDFDDVATLLRTLELIAFIVGLAFTTRYLIGAT